MDDLKLLKQISDSKRKKNKAGQSKVKRGLSGALESCLANAKAKPKKIQKTLVETNYNLIFSRLNTPKRYKYAKLSDFSLKDTTLSEYFRLLQKATFNGRGLILSGGYGIGKTHFVYALAKEFMIVTANKDKTESKIPLVVDFSEFKTNIRNKISESGRVIPVALAYVKKCIEADLLLIDDFFCVDLEDWEKQLLYNIINKRYEYMRAVIVTCNKSPNSIKKLVGGRMWERLSNVNYVKELEGKSLRAKYDTKIIK
jgi:DNA replication protein DnaC